MLSLALKLVLCHILGDFLLQPSKWVEGRSHNPLKSKYLYYHIAVHFVALFLVLINQLSHIWLGILIITISHFCIDYAKILLEKTGKINSHWLFYLDQIFHLAAIAIVVNIYFPYQINTTLLFSDKALIILIAFLIVSSITPILMRLFFDRWNNSLVESETNTEENLKTESLQGAGKFIGILERLLIVIFVNINFLEGIGYLLAAKSIFRFGDLTNSKEKKLTEYILIGTFLSFAIAILVGFALKTALEKLK